MEAKGSRLGTDKYEYKKETSKRELFASRREELLNNSVLCR